MPVVADAGVCSFCGYCDADRLITLGFFSQTIYNDMDAGKLRARMPAERYILRDGDVATLASKRDGRRQLGVRGEPNAVNV
jgi:hypothetical protein